MLVISKVRNYTLRLLSPTVHVIQYSTSLLSCFYDHYNKTMNFYMRNISRIVFHSKDSFGYIAKRKVCYNIKRYPLLRHVHTHKSHVLSFNLDGRKVSDFNLSARFNHVYRIKKYMNNKFSVILHYTSWFEIPSNFLVKPIAPTYQPSRFFPVCLNRIVIYHWLYISF